MTDEQRTIAEVVAQIDGAAWCVRRISMGTREPAVARFGDPVTWNWMRTRMTLHAAQEIRGASMVQMVRL